MFSLLGATLLFLQNVYYIIRSSLTTNFDCRIIPHEGTTNDNWSDTLNSLFYFLLVLLSNQVP
jgi:hypothetical protein